MYIHTHILSNYIYIYIYICQGCQVWTIPVYPEWGFRSFGTQVPRPRTPFEVLLPFSLKGIGFSQPPFRLGSRFQLGRPSSSPSSRPSPSPVIPINHTMIPINDSITQSIIQSMNDPIKQSINHIINQSLTNNIRICKPYINHPINQPYINHPINH